MTCSLGPGIPSVGCLFCHPLLPSRPAWPNLAMEDSIRSRGFWKPIAQQKGSSMFRLRHLVMAFLRRQDGPTAVEYAVVLALIIAVCIVAIQSIGNNVDETAEVVSGALTSSS